MIVGTIVSGIMVTSLPHPAHSDGPLPVSLALLIVTAFGALVIAPLASQMVGSRVSKATILFIVIFALETGLSCIESSAFKNSLGLNASQLIAIAIAGAIRALIAASVAALLWPRIGAVEGPKQSMVGVAPLIVLILYVALYFGAGMFAWRSETVRDFYHGGVNFHLAKLFWLQIGRGVLWTGLACLLASRMRGSRASVACYTAAAFAVLMAAPLLYPNAIMPWAVRQVHLVELALSNCIFGFVAIMLLRSVTPTGSVPTKKALPIGFHP